MNKKPVFTLWYIAIDSESGVTGHAFEEFVRKKAAYIPCYPGWRWTLLRGLRGERSGQYLMLFEIESAAARDRFITSDGDMTAEAKQFWQQHPAAAELLNEWQCYASWAHLPTLFTDYQLLAVNDKSTVKEGPRFLERVNQPPISRVIGIHNLALRAGVTAEQFEHFIAENKHRIEDYPEWKFRLHKGERGNRLDQYVVLMEISSEQALNQFYPDADIGTADVVEFARAHQDTKKMYQEWKTFASFSGSPQIYTDYLAVAENIR